MDYFAILKEVMGYFATLQSGSLVSLPAFSLDLLGKKFSVTVNVQEKAA